jgi:hypothetical protein
MLRRVARRYSSDPTEPEEFTRRFNRFYSWFAPVYGALVKLGPIWERSGKILPRLAAPESTHEDSQAHRWLPSGARRVPVRSSPGALGPSPYA